MPLPEKLVQMHKSFIISNNAFWNFAELGGG